ncbi:hypothetical protein, partial [Escherichia coli]|uniref:hypothetical protein n=1 Tax=Escherichia coli TaxID=562 RepID=UPI00201A9076
RAVASRAAEDAALLAKVRDYLWKNAHLVSTVVSGKEEEGAKFRDYFDHHEPIAQPVPSHRALPKTPRCWRRSVTICGKTPTWSPPSS